jgi:cytochrome c
MKSTITVILGLSVLLAGCGPKLAPGIVGDPVRGKIAAAQYACHSCHVVPGVPGSDVRVGRPLDELAQQPNTQANLVRWIRDPQAIDPGNAMPNMGVSERDAVDISAYLLSH